ncbi:MAG TPA: TetR/AcrR family transcriptional regulator [Myxococcota bacterium]|nr:TetR/AcrR family transcriptional regulator [Myxococcota bacterium]
MATPAPRRDGRTLRAERSRRAIVEAMLAWVGEGVLEPTAQQVADRAQVGIRSVFRHFADMDALYAELGALVRAKARPLVDAVPPQGPVRERLREMVRRRSALFEHIAPYRRSADRRVASSPFLARGHRRVARELRAALRAAVPVLASAPPEREEALDLVLSFEAWDRLRTQQRLSAEQTASILESLALAAWQGSPR